MEDSFLLTAAAIIIFGLMNHFLVEAKPADMLSTMHRLFPFVYWSAVAVLVTLTSQMVNDAVDDAMVTAAVAITGMGLGISIGHLVVESLRAREEYRVDNSCRRAYERVYGQEREIDSGRRSAQEQPQVPDTGRV